MSIFAKGWRRYLDEKSSCDDCQAETSVACLIGNADDSTIVCPACVRKYAATIPADAEVSK
jgi:transcription elongation factor Elf1